MYHCYEQFASFGQFDVMRIKEPWYHYLITIFLQDIELYFQYNNIQ